MSTFLPNEVFVGILSNCFIRGKTAVEAHGIKQLIYLKTTIYSDKNYKLFINLNHRPDLLRPTRLRRQIYKLYSRQNRSL